MYLSKIDYVLWSKKTTGNNGSQSLYLSFFDTITDTNLPTPNTIPKNWKRFQIQKINLFINKAIVYMQYPTTVFQNFLTYAYFEFKISGYTILSENITSLIKPSLNFAFVPSSESNVFELFESVGFNNKSYLELEKPITLEPNMTFTFEIFANNYYGLENAPFYLTFRGILEKEIVG